MRTTCPTCKLPFTPTPLNLTYCCPACWPEVIAEREAELAAADAARRQSTPSRPARRTRSERFSVLNAFVDFGMADLTGAERSVWLVLFRDTKSATGTARVGQEDIARRAGLSSRMVRYALASLEAKGMVRVVHLGRLSAGPSTYRIHPTGTAS